MLIAVASAPGMPKYGVGSITANGSMTSSSSATAATSVTRQWRRSAPLDAMKACAGQPGTLASSSLARCLRSSVSEVGGRSITSW